MDRTTSRDEIHTIEHGVAGEGFADVAHLECCGLE
jgi:hypothetical protein